MVAVAGKIGIVAETISVAVEGKVIVRVSRKLVLVLLKDTVATATPPPGSVATETFVSVTDHTKLVPTGNAPVLMVNVPDCPRMIPKIAMGYAVWSISMPVRGANTGTVAWVESVPKVTE